MSIDSFAGTDCKKVYNGEMRLSIENMPPNLKKRFKAHCAMEGVTMSQAIIRLIELELEKGLLEKDRGGKL
jgi:hypothetical protein